MELIFLAKCFPSSVLTNPKFLLNLIDSIKFLGLRISAYSYPMIQRLWFFIKIIWIFQGKLWARNYSWNKQSISNSLIQLVHAFAGYLTIISFLDKFLLVTYFSSIPLSRAIFRWPIWSYSFWTTSFGWHYSKPVFYTARYMHCLFAFMNTRNVSLEMQIALCNNTCKCYLKSKFI